MEMSDEEMYVTYAPELLRFAAALVGPADADDVVSGAFERALSSPGWISVSAPRAYLYRTVLNESRQLQRSSRRRLAREFMVARPDHFEPDHLRIDVAHAVASLTLHQRAVVYLTYWFGMSIAEVAANVDSSTRTTERALRSARATLRRRLQ